MLKVFRMELEAFMAPSPKLLLYKIWATIKYAYNVIRVIRLYIGENRPVRSAVGRSRMKSGNEIESGLFINCVLEAVYETQVAKTFTVSRQLEFRKVWVYLNGRRRLDKRKELLLTSREN